MPAKAMQIGPLNIIGKYICHPGPTLGYRIFDGKHTVTYIPDHEPALASQNFPEAPKWTSGIDLIQDTDLLIHDAQFSDDEYAQCIGWGHSTVKHAMSLAKMANAKKLVMFHHDPAHTDECLDHMFKDNDCANQDYPIIIGREGEIIIL
jgi:ribonuclease BN (tRNA processing enzyme)